MTKILKIQKKIIQKIMIIDSLRMTKILKIHKIMIIKTIIIKMNFLKYQ